MTVKNELDAYISGFHLDALTSGVPLNVDLDTALEVPIPWWHGRTCASASRHADQPTPGNLNSITAPGIEVRRCWRTVQGRASPGRLGHRRPLTATWDNTAGNVSGVAHNIGRRQDVCKEVC